MLFIASPQILEGILKSSQSMCPTHKLESLRTIPIPAIPIADSIVSAESSGIDEARADVIGINKNEHSLTESAAGPGWVACVSQSQVISAEDTVAEAYCSGRPVSRSLSRSGPDRPMDLNYNGHNSVSSPPSREASSKAKSPRKVTIRLPTMTCTTLEE